MTPTKWAATAFLAVFGLAIVANAQQKKLDIKLAWTPNGETKQNPIPAFDLTGGVYTLAIEKLEDARGKSDQIGEKSGKQPVAVVTTSDVSGFVTDAIVSQVQKAGLELRKEGAERILTGQLLDFWVQERDGYDGKIRAKFTLMDGNKQELWTAMVQGSGLNGGRSLKPLNYTETYTTAVADLISNLFSQQGFVAALRKRGVA